MHLYMSTEIQKYDMSFLILIQENHLSGLLQITWANVEKPVDYLAIHVCKTVSAEKQT